MKKYSVYLSKDGLTLNKDMEHKNKKMVETCDNIENLLNTIYYHQETVDYDKLHSIVEISDNDEKQLLTIFEQEVNQVELIMADEKNTTVSYELNNQQLNYIRDFKKIIHDGVNYLVSDIVYDFNEDVIKIFLVQ